ncbi:hypothetical protein ABIB25_000487 [Nakamurella sp. UYEF19]|uniref:DUF4439 domain-containing protein n=1 Tax=Nakamurella sp. UYEF19 TaxID=1756392 RepID=UPI003398EA33
MTSPTSPSTTSPSTPTTAAPSGKLSALTAKALQVALAAEQVAVWAYDLVAAYDPADADEIAVIRAGHLARQGATASLLIKGGASAPGPAPAYSLPMKVTEVVGARALSAVIEGDCAAAWHSVIGTTDSGSLRTIALAGLSDSAVWLTMLRIAAKTIPATVPFPGRG